MPGTRIKWKQKVFLHKKRLHLVGSDVPAQKIAERKAVHAAWLFHRFDLRIAQVRRELKYPSEREREREREIA